MIQLQLDKTDKTGLTYQSYTQLLDIFSITLPECNKHVIHACDATEVPFRYKITLYDGDNETHNSTSFLYADVEMDKKGLLKLIKYTWNNGNVNTWECTPLNEMMVSAAIEKKQQPEETTKPSPWAIRNQLAHKLFDENYDSATTNEQQTSINPDNIPIPPLLAQNEDGGIIELDGVYDLEPSAAFNNLDDFTTTLGQYWYQLQQTVVKYLKDNKIVTTSIFTVPMVERVELINTSLYATTFNNTILFDDLTLTQQVAITEELLARY